MLALHDKNRLFLGVEYPTLRKLHAEAFEQAYEADIRRGLGANARNMAEWFAKYPAVKEEFFTAIDPKHDDVAGAIRLFSQLVERFPDAFPDHADAAIAVALVWDDARGAGVQDYRGHQRRAKAELPSGGIGALENFKYLLDARTVLEGRERFLPWEFLVLVVNHRTPLDERRWAVQNYLGKRAMIGKCYHDVPYDNIMLETGSQKARLNGQVYNLANIRQFGGVCAMQADFASRVAKSLGVPAAYVGGESRSGENHAWVMWVELLAVAPGRIAFKLESHGRYRGDHYYVGHLRDPQTGLRITDRQLELRLHNVGLSAQNRRHAALIMKTYPLLCRHRDMDIAAKLRLLNNVIRLAPGNEDAWLAIARMSKDGQLTRRHRTVMVGTLDRLFRTFANFPDFTWTVFGDLVAFEDRPRQRADLYKRLVSMYVSAKRPDLACEAVLKYADCRLEEKQAKEAIQALSSTIMTFPDEGRYVPKMLDKLDAVCQRISGGEAYLLDFYQSFLPKVPRTRGGRASPYCKRMYRRAIERFESGGRTEQARYWQAELAKLDPS
ncbi:MAG: hypothetical protein GX621_19310 [Pirellulaceae bacterium]|nr:hypothetical protein [Pirellulaceae bacterium]